MTSFSTRTIALLAVIGLCSAALAQDDTDSGIGPQPLSKALEEFADRSGLQVIYVAELADDKETTGAEPDLSDADTLDQLLASTGLDYEFLNERTVTVLVANEEGESEPGKVQPASSQVLMAQNQTSAAQNQTSPSQTSNSDDEVPFEIEQIIVTGSRIRGAQSASPVVTITRQEIERAGFATVEEIVERLPQNFGAGASQDTYTNQLIAFNAVGGNVGDVAGGTSINLRGLGASSTLVLFNGRRMGTSGQSASFTDISAIPVNAIERVEVLTDGASAIYGADAIGGVINFIMRDDYEGAETRLRYGSDSGGDTSEILFGQSFGASWDGGHALMSYEYFYRDNLAYIDRDFAASNDLTRFGGDDFRSEGGNPANIRATLADGTSQTFAIPTGQDGRSLTAADFDLNAPLNMNNAFEFLDMMPEQERHSAFLSLSQSIGTAEVFADVRYSTRDIEANRSVSTANITVPGDDPATPEIEGNPFFVDPTGTGLASVSVRGYSFGNDIGPTTASGETDTTGVALGLRFDMGEKWEGELAGNWSTEEASRRSGISIDRDALDAAVAQTDPNVAFNPFGDGSNTNPIVLEALLSSGRVNVSSENELREVTFNVNGSLFNAPGGAVKLAAGIQYRDEALLVLEPPQIGDGLETTIDDSREIMAAYAELFFPVVTDGNGRPGLQRLELSVAARYEDYSDFGDSTNPKFGVVWAPTKSLILRGTWGTSFKAPQLTDLNVNSSLNMFTYLPQFFVDIGAIPFTTLVMAGANGDLQPEEATTWTAGFQWTPENVKGLSLDVTYFDIDFEDRIDVPFISLLDGYRPRFSSLLNTNPTAEQIAEIANDRRYVETTFAGTTPVADLLSGAAPVGAIMDRRINNLSQSVVTGLELQLSYQFEAALGVFGVGLNGNYLFDFERALLATDPLVDEVDTLGRPVDFRARAELTWSRNAWSGSAFINYMDGYSNNVSDPVQSIDSWTTVDFTILYNTGESAGFLSDTRVSLTAQNLFGEDPPFVNNFGLSYDQANANGLGRFLAVQVTKVW